jgi:putative ATPase
MHTTYNLFSEKKEGYIPLAERCRPRKVDEVIGHKKFLHTSAPLRRQIESGKLSSIIFWGPPGVGKTTIAKVIAEETNFYFKNISAVTSGKKELAQIIEQARIHNSESDKGYVLFIDEIHRYNKAQQDGLLHAVEDGTITLLGATTENPSFEIIAPLLSRCQVYKLDPLSSEELKEIVLRALQEDAVLSSLQIKIAGMDELLSLGSGDARRTLNLLETCLNIIDDLQPPVKIGADIIKQAAQYNSLLYDKKGDYHYDTISAFIKSIRGSDPDAAVFYLARMLEAGEDPVFIARRLIILASEDVGNAEPYALSLANAGLQAVHAIGMPEAKIVLSQVATYLASCPKSNAAYLASNKAWKDVQDHSTLQVPLHLRNAPTELMKRMNYGTKYKYPHDFPHHFIEENYLPDKLKNTIYYEPTEQGREKLLKERLDKLWNKRQKTKRKNSS